MNINTIFPYDVPTPAQHKLLSDIARDFNRYDVFLINAPVAFGKSAVAKAIMNIANSKGMGANWVVPTNELVRQGVDEFDLPTLYRKKEYDKPASYRDAKETITHCPQAIINYWTLLANKLYKPVHIFDESHGLIPMLQDMKGVRYWETDKGFPENAHTTTQLLLWMAERASWDVKARQMLEAMEAHPNMYTTSYEWDEFRGNMKQCIRLYPLSPRNNPPILWPPSRTKKIFLMSATTSPTDLYELGLDDRRVVQYEAPSGIPKENRPCIFHGLGSMSRGGIRENLPKLVEFINYCLDNEQGKGFIHATYGMASRLRAELGDHPRLRWHSRSNKSRQFNRWLKANDNTVFVGSGLTEGINLKGDLCRWQVITKVPFPSLGDPAIFAKRQNDEKWYVWQAVRDVLQAYGRVCRGPSDVGKTWVVDSAFISLYNKNREMFPHWFREAIV